jgi:hypothetical protein
MLGPSLARGLISLFLQCALVASLIASLMSWNWFPVPALIARIAALCAMIHSVGAIGIAAQQLIALTRAYIHPNRTEIIQYILFGHVLPSSSCAGTSVTPPSQLVVSNAGGQQRWWWLATLFLANTDDVAGKQYFIHTHNTGHCDI